MAIAGLHNVSVLDSPFLRESQSPVSSRRSDQARLSTQTSSPRQMWRDLEDEQVGQGPGRGQGRFQQQRSDELNTDLSSVTVSESQRSVDGGGLDRLSEVEYGPWSQSQAGSQNENDDSNGLGCEPSPDFGDVERERVRQIFRDWMNSGMMGHTSNVSQVNNTTRAQWLGETEQERVRIVREWVQMTSQPRGTLSARREEQVAEIGAQIERVRDGLVVNCHEGQTEPVRRVGILRLCGRQALLDMLVRTGRERQRELQQLSEHRVVSDFAHRNRIQVSFYKICLFLHSRYFQLFRLIKKKKKLFSALSRAHELFMELTSLYSSNCHSCESVFEIFVNGNWVEALKSGN